MGAALLSSLMAVHDSRTQDAALCRTSGFVTQTTDSIACTQYYHDSPFNRGHGCYTSAHTSRHRANPKSDTVRHVAHAEGALPGFALPDVQQCHKKSAFSASLETRHAESSPTCVLDTGTSRNKDST